MFDPKKFLNQKNLKKQFDKLSKVIDETKEIAVSRVFEKDIEKTLNAKSIRQLRLNILARINELKGNREWDDTTMKRIQDLEGVVRKSLLKPKLAIVGMSDVGKSHLTNALLGTSKIPSDWSPMTSINIYIKHIEDRPDFFSDEVIIFSGEQDGFDVNRVDERAYSENCVLMRGGEDLLLTYATRMSEINVDENKAKAAVVYLDSPILERCDIIDVPGFGTGDRELDDQYAQESRQIADLVLYMSVSNAFMRGTDISFLKSTIDTLPFIEGLGRPLQNLFVLASQSHIIGDEAKVNQILDAGMRRFYRSVPEEEWASHSNARGLEYSEVSIRERCHPYTTNDEETRRNFEVELIKVLDVLPPLIEEQTRKTLKDMIENQRRMIEKEILQHEAIVSDRKEYSDRLHILEVAEPERRLNARRERQEIHRFIEGLKEKDIFRFRQEYADVMDTKKIVNRIDEAGIKKDEEGQNALVNLISNDLRFRLNQALEISTEEFVEKVDGYVENFESDIDIASIGSNGLNVSFDVKNVFVGGAVGAVAFGGMAAYAAAMGNLGGYILIAKGAGILSALGLNVGIFGGMSGIMGGVAAIGGPITLGIALTAVIGFSVYMALSATAWKEAMAKGIRKSFEKEGAEKQFVDGITKYWDDTRTGFDAGADELEREWRLYIENMRAEIDGSETSEIEKQIETLSRYETNLSSLKSML